jgi:hypothetical protein
MSGESYEYYLRSLKLPRTASDEEIRAAITNEVRLWARRTNAPTLEVRQEAERKMQALETAEKVLLGAEGRIIRTQLGNHSSAQPECDVSVDADTVVRAIECIASTKGTKSQERRGTVLYRRSSIFFSGVDYLVEEVVHKPYEAFRNQKRLCATQGSLVLFDWLCGSENQGPGKARNYVQGPWATELVAFAAQCGNEMRT